MRTRPPQRVRSLLSYLRVPTQNELKKAFEQFQIHKYEEVVDVGDWGSPERNHARMLARRRQLSIIWFEEQEVYGDNRQNHLITRMIFHNFFNPHFVYTILQFGVLLSRWMRTTSS